MQAAAVRGLPPLVLQTKAAYVLFYQRRDDEVCNTPSQAAFPGCSEGDARPSGSQQVSGEEETCSMDTN